MNASILGKISTRYQKETYFYRPIIGLHTKNKGFKLL